MKKLILLLIFISGTAFGQSDIAIEKAKQYFADDYVRSNFKDPHSYEFKSASAIQFTLDDEITSIIDALRYKIENTDSAAADFDAELYGQMVASKNKIIKKYLALNEIEKQRIIKYNVFLECNGKNSYGNSVFQKYLITVLRNHSENKWEIEKVEPWD